MFYNSCGLSEVAKSLLHLYGKTPQQDELIPNFFTDDIASKRNNNRNFINVVAVETVSLKIVIFMKQNVERWVQ